MLGFCPKTWWSSGGEAYGMRGGVVKKEPSASHSPYNPKMKDVKDSPSFPDISGSKPKTVRKAHSRHKNRHPSILHSHTALSTINSNGAR
jgi:hypothetical protein